MDKPNLNFVIDACMFLCLTALAGLGTVATRIVKR